MDSGAYSLYNLFVRKFGENVGKHGRPLDRAKVRRGQGDFSGYDLSPGTPFRRYCDSYARCVKKIMGDDGLKEFYYTNVDVITNPEKTWEVQQFFEQEHGLHPVPVLHFGTPVKWLEKYLEAGHYDLIGMGGLGQSIKPHHYPKWADVIFSRICPKSNDYLPIVKMHGFALTAIWLMKRWPWWSVDSATWIKLAAYGWILVPPWREDTGFRFDLEPLQINISRKVTERKWKFWWRVGVRGPRQTRNKHIDNAHLFYRESTQKWLEHLDMPLGRYGDDNEILERGVATNFEERASVNLTYFQEFVASRPKWPHPLDPMLVKKEVSDRLFNKSNYINGFGL